MLIVLGLYFGVIYLIFGALSLLPWNTFFKSVVAFGGLVIALAVIGALNYLTPSGRVTIQGPTIDITPNVGGTVVEVFAEPNVPMKEGDLLFRIDKTPFTAEVERLSAALAQEEAEVRQRDSELAEAKADVERLEAQLDFAIVRRDDIQRLVDRGASPEFQGQEAIATVEQAEASLRAARARRQSIEKRIASKVDGIDSAVVQAQHALARAQFDLDQTEVRAPMDGVATAVALRPGNRVTPVRSAIAFVPEREKLFAAVFPQSGSHGIEEGDTVLIALRTLPGTYFETKVERLMPGTAEGTITATGTLPSIGQLLGSGQFVALLTVPKDLPPEAVRLGTSGTAMRITENAGPIEPLAWILFWINRMMNYL